jgi:NADPH-dependent 2,4-dienoyl-CoA reductase/sulfur reductase-like enzyme/nitrite reductase/ring-hydroxylating ferredoxin subunit
MNDHETAAAKLSEIKAGEMKEIMVGDNKVLLARVGDRCYALGAHCTHYGAPLVEGALVGDKLICPWHHACFDATNGDMHEPPALDSLPGYEIRTDGDDIFVEFSDPATDRRTPQMAAPEAGEKRVFVILGGGAAGYVAAQTLREDGFQGRIVMVTREEHLPYDRPNLSKDYLQGNAEPSWIPLRPDEFYGEHGIEVMNKREVVKIDAAASAVEFGNGEKLGFDSLLIALGGVPRSLDLPNADLKNIFTLRSFADSDAIVSAAANAKRAVVIGASFIGMETASSLRQRGLSVTVVAPDALPFERTLGVEIGRLFQSVHEQNGVEFRLGAQAESFEGDSSVSAVVLHTGERIETDIVIVGIGVMPATKNIEGIALHKDGGVITDDHLRIAENIYAAGDIVHFPDPRSGELVRIEHWRTALQQGRTAAHNMAGRSTRFTGVPFFWTTQFDVTLNYVGHTQGWDEIIIQGDPSKKDFLAFYVKDFRVLAVAGMNRDTDLAYMEELIRTNRVPAPDRLRGGSQTGRELYEFGRPAQI